MTLPLPPFVTTEHNTETGKLKVGVLDPEVRHQKAMWGESPQFQLRR